jgi:hypothetical protein
VITRALLELAEVCKGRSAISALHSCPKVAEAVMLCQHLYMGAFLLPHEMSWLKACLERILESDLGANGEALYPFIRTDRRWAGALKTLT